MYRKLTHTFLTFHFIFILLISSRFNFLSFLKDRTVTANANTVILIHFYSHYFKPNNLSLLYGARLHYNEIMHIYSTYFWFKNATHASTLHTIYAMIKTCNKRPCTAQQNPPHLHICYVAHTTSSRPLKPVFLPIFDWMNYVSYLWYL